MADFNLTSQVLLEAPPQGNIDQVIARIRSGLGKLGPVDVKLNVSSADITKLRQVEQALQNIQVQAASTQLSVSGISKGLDAIGTAQTRASSNTRQAKGNFNDLNRTLNETVSLTEQFGRTAGLAARRFLGYSVAAGAIITLVAAMKSGITNALNFERELVRLQQVGVDSKAELRDLANEITNLGVTLGVSSKELAEAAVTLKQAGFTAQTTKDVMKTLAETGLAPTFKDIKDTTEIAIAAMAQFNIEGKETYEVFGAINAVAAAFAVESKDIGDVIKRAGGSFKAIGGTLNELMALYTSVRSTTRESAESIATGFRTIFTRIQRPELIDNLRELGVNLRYTKEEAEALGDVNLERQFVGGYEAIRRLGQAMKDLPTQDPRYAIIAEELGGYRQISKVLPLLQQQELQQKALNVAQLGSISLLTSTEQSQNSYLQRLSKIKEEFLAIFRAIGDSGTFKAVAAGLELLTKGLLKVLSVADKVLPIFTAIATVKFTSFLANTLSGRGEFFSGVGVGFQSGNPVRSFRQYRNSGGLIGGDGDGDTVPAMLTPGEYVLRKQAVRRIGLANLERMNKGIKGYNTGGLVDEFGIPISDREKRKLILNSNTGNSGNLYIPLSSKRSSLNDFMAEERERQSQYLEEQINRQRAQNKINRPDLVRPAEVAPVIGMRTADYRTPIFESTSERDVFGQYNTAGGAYKPVRGQAGKYIGPYGKGAQSTNLPPETQQLLKGPEYTGGAATFDTTVKPHYNITDFVQNVAGPNVASRTSTLKSAQVGLDLPNFYARTQLGTPTNRQGFKGSDVPLIPPGGGSSANTFTNVLYKDLPQVLTKLGYSSTELEKFMVNVQDKFPKLGKALDDNTTVFLRLKQNAEGTQVFLRDFGGRNGPYESTLAQRLIRRGASQEGAAEAARRSFGSTTGIDASINDISSQRKTVYDVNTKKPIQIPLSAEEQSVYAQKRLKEKLASKRTVAYGGGFFRGLGTRLSNLDLNTSLIAGSVIAGGAGYLADRATPEITGNLTAGNTTRAYAAQGAGSAIQGGATGLIVSSLLKLNPIGAIATTVGTGLAFLAGSITDTYQKIKEAKIQVEMTTFADTLKKVNEGLISGKNEDLLANVQRRRKEFSPGFFESLTGDYEGQAATLSEQIRGRFSEQFTEIYQFLNKSASGIGESSSVRLSQLKGDDLNNELDKLRVNFLNANDGLNKEFIKLIADAKKIKVSDVVKEMDRALNQGIRAASLAKQEAEIREIGLRRTQSLGRIENVITGAASRANNREFTLGLSSTLDRSKDLDSPATEGFLIAVREVSDSFGENAKDIEATGRAYNAIFSNLAPILQEVGKSGGIEGKSTGGRVEDLLISRIGKGGPEQNAIIREVVNSINKLVEDDPGKFGQGVQFNVDKLIEEQLVKSFKDFSTVISNSNKLIQDQFSKFADNLDKLNKLEEGIIQRRFELSQATLDTEKFAAENAARAAGRPGAGLDFLSLEQLQRPFNENQTELTKRSPVNPLDAESIGRRVSDLDNEIIRLRGFGQDPQALQNLKSTEGERNNLVKALENLANNSIRLQATMDKLNESYRKSDALRGAVGGLLTASPREVGKTAIGLAGAQKALERPEGLRGINPLIVKNIFDSLDQFADINLGILGGKTGREAKGILTEKTRPDLFKKGEDEQAKLRQQATEELKRREEAQKALVKIDEESRDRFTTNFKAVLDGFIKDMKLLDLSRKLANEESGVQDLLTKENEVKGQLEATNKLKSFGLNQDQVTKLARGGQAGNLYNKLQDINKAKTSSNQTFTPSLDLIKNFTFRGNRFEDKFELIKELNNLQGSNPFDTKELDRLKSAAETAGGNDNFKNLIRERLIEIIRGRDEGFDQQERDAKKSFKDQTGITPPIQGLKELVDALEKVKPNPDAFSNAGKELDQLNIQLENFRKAIIKTKGEIANVKPPIVGRNPVGPAIGLSGGGSIFQARGTDTVPAMLTPGEFVVNRAAAEQYGGLLEQINSGGPVYMADGGDLIEEMRENLRRAPLPQNRRSLESIQRQMERGRGRAGLNYIANPEHRALYAEALRTGDLESYFVGLRNIKPTTVSDLAGSPDPFLQKRFARFNQQVPGFTDSLVGRNKPIPLAQVQENERAKPLSVFRGAEQRANRAIAKRNLSDGIRIRNPALNDIFFGNNNPPKLPDLAGEFEQFQNRKVLQQGRRFDQINNLNIDNVPARANNGPDEFKQFQARKQAGQGGGNVAFIPGPKNPINQQRQTRPPKGPATIRVPRNDEFLNIGRRFTKDQSETINRIKKRPRLDPTYVNAKAQTFNRGGYVKPAYMAQGGEASGSMSVDIGALTSFGVSFQSSTSNFSSAINSFAQSSNRLSDVISKFPQTLTGVFNHTINVNFNGADVMERMVPTMQELAVQEAKNVLNKYVSERMEDAGRMFE